MKLKPQLRTNDSKEVRMMASNMANKIEAKAA